jgi:hypothetical protein
MEDNPIKLNGIWDEGYALDLHSISSVPIYDDFGDIINFTTTRTHLGEMLYKFKYKLEDELADEITRIASNFIINTWGEKIDFLIPAPPSNKYRRCQPVFLLAEKIANLLGINYDLNFFYNDSPVERKNNNSILKILKLGNLEKNGTNVLLLDDLYGEGKTLTEMTKLIKTDSNIGKVFVLTITKKRT